MRRHRYLTALLLLLLLTGGVHAGDLKIDMGPTLGDLTPNSALLTWHTNKPTVAWLEVSGARAGEGGPTAMHRVRLEGLLPGTVYSYTVKATAGGEVATAGPYKFRTPSPWLARWTFCAYGDTRSRPDEHRQVLKAMATVPPRLILNTGDLVENGRKLEDWYQFFPVLGIVGPSIPYYSCLGNHERNAELYYQLLPLPGGGGDFQSEWYSVVFGNCQFISLNSCRRIDEQTEWLRDLLSKPRPQGVDWRIVMFHYPPFSSGNHGSNATMQTEWCPLLENGDVDLVFGGHDHIYERSQHGGLYYVTLGTGGAPLYAAGANDNPFSQFAIASLGFLRIDVTPEKLNCTFLDPQLQVLDQFTVVH